MSEKYETVKRYWNLGLWNEQKVRNAVAKGWITSAEFKVITGKNY